MPVRLFPIFLGVPLIFCYGLFAPWLGYYGDDWPKIYDLTVLGLDGIVRSQSIDRPLWGWILGFVYQFIGDSPLGWQVFGLGARWLSAVALWVLVRELWPKQLVGGAAIVLLFIVYPGIMQESRAFTYGTIWFQLALSLFSLAFMARAIQIDNRRLVLTTIAILCAGISWNISEYFVGFELLRPFILWMVFSKQSIYAVQRIASTAKTWLIYVIAFLSYMFWRLFIFDTTRTEVNPTHFLEQIISDPFSQIVQRLNYVIPDVLETSFLVWPAVLSPTNLSMTARSTWLAWLVAGIMMAMIFFILQSLSKRLSTGELYKQDMSGNWCMLAVIGGLVFVIFGMSPIWFSNVHYVHDTGASRYALPAIAGASVFLVGLIRWIAGDSRKFAILVSIFVGVGTAGHIKSANSYRYEWAEQREFFWQLAWRAPSLEPGTILWLHSDAWRERHPADYTYAMPLNLIYAPQHDSAKLIYWVLPLEENIDILRMPNKYDTEYRRQVRNLRFEGHFEQSVVVWYSPPGCLRILDSNSNTSSNGNSLISFARNYSNVELVISDSATVEKSVTAVFGVEPNHNWCYFFQKAELARQAGNWERVVELGDDARRKGLVPEDATEWLPFLEGYRAMGREEEMSLISKMYLSR